MNFATLFGKTATEKALEKTLVFAGGCILGSAIMSETKNREQEQALRRILWALRSA
jgi:tryptophan synthase alpha subunit